LEITMEFILGFLTGVIAVKIYKVVHGYYVWNTYKDNIDWGTR